MMEKLMRHDLSQGGCYTRNKLMDEEKRITVHLATKDRHSELALCLQSLRTQTVQDWDLILSDESKTPITTCYFLTYIINRIKLEGHRVKLIRNEISKGVCHIRNKLIEEDKYNNPLTLRLDDDCILENDYIEKLMEVIDKGYELASGIIPLLSQPELVREIKFVKPIINKHKFDKEGNLIMQNDDCGFAYIEKEILPTHQFRTNCLYKSEINKKVKYPSNLTFTSFREEGFFSIKTILEGYTIGVHTGAVAFHLATPSGGVRPDNPQLYVQNVQLDNQTFLEFMKKQFEEKGDFLTEYKKKVMK